MRIIGGLHRSRRIKPPQGIDTTRPITDRVKQSLFDRLTSAAAYDGACLDIFSGTGSLGLEALSRGMEHCTFIEQDRSARELLQENIDALGLTDQATVMGVDALTTAWQVLLPVKPVNLLFCDPPYSMTDGEPEMARIAALIESLATVTEAEALLVLRTSEHAAPRQAEGWQGPLTHVYGSQILHFYERNGD